MANIPELDVINELDQLEINIQGSTDCDKICSKINFKKSFLNIIHFNIRSINKNFNQFLVLLQAFKLIFYDIIVLSETWQLGEDDKYDIDGYTMHYNGANVNQNDGVIIYIRSEINANIENIKLTKSGVTFSKVCFKLNNINYGVTCAYRPFETKVELFLEDFEQYLSNNLENQIELLIGDMNIDIIKKNEQNVNLYLSTLNLYGFQSTINGPTHIKTCLDHIFIKNKLKSNLIRKSTFILNSDLTDHFPVMISFLCDNNNKNETKYVTKTTNTINYETFRNLISNETWLTVVSEDDVEISTEKFCKIVTDILSQSKEKKTCTYKDRNKIKPWITNGIINSIKQRDKMKKRLLSNNSTNAKNTYKNYRNNLHKIIQNCKYNYYKRQIEGNTHNYKKVYQIISEAVDDKKIKNKNNLIIKDDNNHPFANKKLMANYCNNFFTNIGNEMANKITTPTNIFNIQYNSLSSMFLKPVNEKEIIRQINSLKNNCAPGIDGIDSKLIKTFHLELLKPLKHIINLIFKTGVVPTHFKTSIVTPIHKAGDKSKINNFRPISVISNFSKIFEKCLKERLVDFFACNDVLSTNQFGFCNGLSTTDAIYVLAKNITDNLDSSNKCLAVFLDLAKAFDTVPHDSLLNVLDIYGVRGHVLKVFESYLGNRSQIVKVDDAFSDPLTVKIGVPQGTVLGPLLFITYINSLTNINIDNGTVISYADDTVVIFRGKTWEEVRNSTKAGITRIKNWLDSFKLTLNISKTNYIAFSLTMANRPDFSNIQFEGMDQVINEVASTKYLGITIDQHLKWDEHVLKLSNNIRKLIRKFYILREFLGKKLLSSVYKALVESLIRYGLVIWGGLTNTCMKQLNVVQNYILKIINRKEKRYPTSLLYSEEILDVRSLYILCTCSLVHKKTNLKNYVNHSYATRNRSNKHLVIPNSKTSINQRFLNYLAPKTYNMLPLSIRSISNLKRFNYKCATFIVQNLHSFMKLF